MNKATVLSLVLWLQKADRASYHCNEIELDDLFINGYYFYYNTKDIDDVRIKYDLEDFKKYGRIPIYVLFFIHGSVYPKLRRPHIPLLLGGPS